MARGASRMAGTRTSQGDPGFRLLFSKAYRAAIRALLRGMSPPGIIFAPGRRPAMLVRLQTADHIRLASPMQEEQGAVAPGDRTRIMGFPVCEQVAVVALGFMHPRRRIGSAVRHHTGLLPVRPVCARRGQCCGVFDGGTRPPLAEVARLRQHLLALPAEALCPPAQQDGALAQLAAPL
jgi:hypothetical protein